jgi:hypothetical protein
MEAEAINITKGWGIPYDPNDRLPLEKIARDHYVVAATRASLEKRINRYSMVQRLQEDGHTVLEVELAHHKKIADRMKIIKNQIDRDWANAIAIIKLSLTDDLELARKLEQLEAPNPEQRAKAKKIRLLEDCNGVNFDNPEICYQAIRNYEALIRGVKLEAAARNILVVGNIQKQATIKHFQEPIVAIHHLPHEADRAGLIFSCGILEILKSDQAFHSLSPEILELKRKILAKADEWSRYFGFNFAPEQPAISFLTRAGRRLGVSFYSSRPGGEGEERPRQYRVYTPELIDHHLTMATEEINQMRLNQVQMELKVTELSELAWCQARSVEQEQSINNLATEGNDLWQTIQATGQVISAIERLTLRLEGQEQQLFRLMEIRGCIDVRELLLSAVLERYAAIASTISLEENPSIESVDLSKIEGWERGDRSSELATG